MWMVQDLLFAGTLHIVHVHDASNLLKGEDAGWHETAKSTSKTLKMCKPWLEQTLLEILAKREGPQGSLFFKGWAAIIHNLETVYHFVTLGYQLRTHWSQSSRISAIATEDEMDMTRCKWICRAADTLNMVRHIEVPTIVMALELSWTSPDISKILISLLIQKSNI